MENTTMMYRFSFVPPKYHREQDCITNAGMMWPAIDLPNLTPLLPSFQSFLLPSFPKLPLPYTDLSSVSSPLHYSEL